MRCGLCSALKEHDLIFGYSMGGALACSYSVLYPDRVRGVVHVRYLSDS